MELDLDKRVAYSVLCLFLSAVIPHPIGIFVLFFGSRPLTVLMHEMIHALTAELLGWNATAIVVREDGTGEFRWSCGRRSKPSWVQDVIVTAAPFIIPVSLFFIGAAALALNHSGGAVCMCYAAWIMQMGRVDFADICESVRNHFVKVKEEEWRPLT